MDVRAWRVSVAALLLAVACSAAHEIGSGGTHDDSGAHAPPADCRAVPNPVVDGGVQLCADAPDVHGSYRATWATAIDSSWNGDIGADSSGNVVWMDELWSRSTIGSMDVEPSNSDSLNTFVAKLDRTGHTAWARVFPGASPVAVRSTSSGGIYFVADALRNVDVGTGPLQPGAFLAKLDSSGTTLWTRALEPTPDTNGGAFGKLAVDDSGNTAVLGSLSAPIQFGNTTVPAGNVVMSFDSNGNYRYSLGFYGLDLVSMRTAFDGGGLLHIAGNAVGSVQVGGSAVPETSGLLDVVVDAGNVVRARRVGTGMMGGLVLANPTGGYVLGGNASGAIDLGSSRSDDAGLAFAWLEQGGSTYRTKVFPYSSGASVNVGIGLGASMDPAGQLLLTMGMGATTDLGGGPLLGYSRALVLVLDSSGSHVFSGAYGGPAESYGRVVVADEHGFWLLGTFNGVADFDGFRVGPSQGFSTFLARFEPGTPPASSSRRCAQGDPAPAGASAVTLTSNAAAQCLAADANEVFWSDGAAIFKASTSCGAAQLLAYGRKYVQALVSDERNLYWVERGENPIPPETATGAVLSMPRSGGEPTVLTAHQAGPTSMTLSGGALYWTNGADYNGAFSNAGEIGTLSLSGGAARVLASGLTWPHAISVRGDTIVFAQSELPGSADIMRTDVNGSAPVIVAAAHGGAVATALDAEHVYWIVPSTNGVDTSNNDGQVMSAPLDGSSSPIVLVGSLTNPTALAFAGDAGPLYWTTGGSFINQSKHDASLSLFDPQSGAVRELISGRAPMSALATTSTRVFWSEVQLDPRGAQQAPYRGIYDVEQ